MKIRKRKKIEALFLGMELVVLEIVGLYIGQGVDAVYRTQGLGVIVGGGLALVIWFYRVMKVIRREKE